MNKLQLITYERDEYKYQRDLWKAAAQEAEARAAAAEARAGRLAEALKEIEKIFEIGDADEAANAAMFIATDAIAREESTP